ncbi:MAG TPA: histidine phosphatase family protein [Bacillales bacterium]|nr:histidine phosphatase family protein [Bacillales bacterium]
MTRIGIIRHGSTPWNKEGRAQGSSDIPLDETGRAEAGKLADRLSTESWDVIYSSNLLRAKQTAEIVGEKVGRQIQLDPRLREAGGGQIEGTTEEERVLKWGKDWRELDLGLEKAESVITRGLSFVEEIVAQHENKKILIVSHGSFIRHLLLELLPNASTEWHLKNTSLTTLFKTGNGWGCELYNCTRHLDGEGVR